MNNYDDNRTKLLKKVNNNSVVIMFSGTKAHKSGDAFYKYWVERNFHYLTGMTGTGQIYTAYKHKNKIKETLWIIERNPQEIKWIGDVIHKDEASKISGINDIRNTKNFSSFLDILLLNGDIEFIYTGFDRRSSDMAPTIEERFSKNIIEKYPYLEIRNIFPEIHKQRMIKKKYEIDALKKAIEITNKGIHSILRNLKPGSTENEMEAYFDFELKKNNVKWHAFQTIAAGGKNAATLHYEENCAQLKDGDLILFDLGAQWNQYNADISRTFPVNGKYSEEQKSFYELVLKTNKEVIKSVRPGVPFSNLQKTSRDVLFDGLKSMGLINTQEELFKYYFHGVSHYLGLDTHDVGYRDVNLKPGMVFTVEPSEA